jgi:hypothetical protein
MGNNPNDPNQFVFGQQIYGYPARRTRWWLWILFIFVLIAIPLGIAFVVLSNVAGIVGGFDNLLGEVLAPEMRAVPGDATRFDPLAALDEAQALAGEGAQLASLTAQYVRADGTMDLNASLDQPFWRVMVAAGSVGSFLRGAGTGSRTA